VWQSKKYYWCSPNFLGQNKPDRFSLLSTIKNILRRRDMLPQLRPPSETNASPVDLRRRYLIREGGGSMPIPHERALAYLNALEADRHTALALSEQKAAEAKLIEARQEGFRAAMKMFGEDICVVAPGQNSKEPAQRRARRPIPELIVRELSFSGKPMTAHQIATAVDYNLERTETALRRLAEAGKVERTEKDRWELPSTITAQLSVRAVTGANGKHPAPAERVAT